MITSQEARERAVKGADYLTASPLGRSWIEKINLDQLDLENFDACVWGQLFGEEDARDQLDWGSDLSDPWPSEHGFILRPGEDYSSGREDAAYRILTEAWREEISSRLNAANQEA